MNSYFKQAQFIFEKHETAYFELSQDRVCLRALYVVENQIFNTNINIETPNYFLPEGKWETTQGLFEITPNEFLAVWDQSILPYLKGWTKLKITTPIGSSVEGTIVCFYPQGVILMLGFQFYGLANYKQCEKVIGGKKMHPGNKLVLTVQKFDDSNMWAVLE